MGCWSAANADCQHSARKGLYKLKLGARKLIASVRRAGVGSVYFRFVIVRACQEETDSTLVEALWSQDGHA